ncbi:MAG: PQQ-binding-like beta-propeller repeat protein [Gemmataceae bacterium]
MIPMALTLMCLAPGAQPAAWPGFLGAGGSPLDANTLPLKWSPTENVAWQAKLPGQGQSAPVIWGGTVFVTCIDGPTKDTCHVVALSLVDGKQHWVHTRPGSQKVRSNYFQSRSAPTPVVDADRVYAFFETGDLLALTHDGKVVWERSLVKDYGNFESTIGLASSLTQTSDAVFVLIDHEGPSYLLAVDKKTGKNLWKAERDSRKSYASPMLMRIGDKDQIVISSDGSVDGYDPATGKLLWSFDDVGGNVSGTAFPVGPGRFLVSATPGMHSEREKEAKRSNFLMTVEATKGEFKPTVSWRVSALPNFANPVTHKDVAYWVNKTGIVTAYDVKGGKELFSERIKQTCWAAPLGVGDRVYFFGKDGFTTVLKAGAEFEVLSVNQLWDPNVTGRDRLGDGGGGRPTPKGEKKDEPGRRRRRQKKSPRGCRLANRLNPACNRKNALKPALAG